MKDRKTRFCSTAAFILGLAGLLMGILRLMAATKVVTWDAPFVNETLLVAAAYAMGALAAAGGVLSLAYTMAKKAVLLILAGAACLLSALAGMTMMTVEQADILEYYSIFEQADILGYYGVFPAEITAYALLLLAVGAALLVMGIARRGFHPPKLYCPPAQLDPDGVFSMEQLQARLDRCHMRELGPDTFPIGQENYSRARYIAHAIEQLKGYNANQLSALCADLKDCRDYDLELLNYQAAKQALMNCGGAVR